MRFQIHAGFIFEDKVAADLASYGFAVTDITRINRQEFDVVTVLGDVIHNFQCKNNWIDLGKLESDRRLLARSEEHTSELQSLMRISYAVFCLKKKKQHTAQPRIETYTLPQHTTNTNYQ